MSRSQERAPAHHLSASLRGKSKISAVSHIFVWEILLLAFRSGPEQHNGKPCNKNLEWCKCFTCERIPIESTNGASETEHLKRSISPMHSKGHTTEELEGCPCKSPIYRRPKLLFQPRNICKESIPLLKPINSLLGLWLDSLLFGLLPDKCSLPRHSDFAKGSYLLPSLCNSSAIPE